MPLLRTRNKAAFLLLLLLSSQLQDFLPIALRRSIASSFLHLLLLLLLLQCWVRGVLELVNTFRNGNQSQKEVQHSRYLTKAQKHNRWVKSCYPSSLQHSFKKRLELVTCSTQKETETETERDWWEKKDTEETVFLFLQYWVESRLAAVTKHA